jgi:alkyl hydroperoxide reductase subunit AhpF
VAKRCSGNSGRRLKVRAESQDLDFAAGAMTAVPCTQIVIAVGEGAKASLSDFGQLIRSD